MFYSVARIDKSFGSSIIAEFSDGQRISGNKIGLSLDGGHYKSKWYTPNIGKHFKGIKN